MNRRSKFTVRAHCRLLRLDPGPDHLFVGRIDIECLRVTPHSLRSSSPAIPASLTPPALILIPYLFGTGVADRDRTAARVR